MLTVAEAEAENSGTKSIKDTPRLVVNITVDQLRSDYLETFMPLYGEQGLKKLLADGLVYRHGLYPFQDIDRASATATLATGATPSINGIPSAEWMSRKNGKAVLCTTNQDNMLTERIPIPSAINLKTSTTGDELKISTRGLGKVFSIATECDAAIMSAGHNADGAFWIEPQTGLWTTTSYYNTPLPYWVTNYNRAHPVTGKGKVDYSTSSIVNAAVTDMALQCIKSAQLGTDQTPDILNLQYYAGNFAHKAVTNYVSDLKDTYTKLDDAIAKLITSIEQTIGKDKVMFVVTSTGYSDNPQIDLSKYNIPAGTVYINRTANLLNMYLSAFYGQAEYVEGCLDNNIYLNHRTIEKKSLKLNEILERSTEMLLLSDGVTGIHTSMGLRTNTNSSNQLIANGYTVGVSGDIIIETAPGWKVFNEQTQRLQHKTEQAVPFPIIFYGAGIPHQIVEEPVRTTQIAPTISKSIRIRAPNACKSTSLL